MRTPFIDLPKMQITTQSGVMVEEDDLVKLNLEQQKALDWLLRDVGAEQLLKHIELERIRPRRQQQRRAARKALDDEVRNAAGRVLKAKKLKPKGRDYFRKSAGKDNFVYVKSLIDQKASEYIGRVFGERAEWTAEEIELIRTALPGIVQQIGDEL